MVFETVGRLQEQVMVMVKRISESVERVWEGNVEGDKEGNCTFVV